MAALEHEHPEQGAEFLLAELLRLADQQMDVFYPEFPEERARQTLRQMVYLIRGDLGPQSVQSTPSGYALGAAGSDLEEFLESGEAGLWRGPYLQGLSDGWNANVRDGLELALRSRAESLLNPDAARWAGSVPAEKGKWSGTNPAEPLGGTWKTWVLASPGQFRPGPPFAFDSAQMAKDLAELKEFRRTILTNLTAAYWHYYGGRA